MANVTKSVLRLSSLSRLQSLAGTQSVRYGGNWNKDWKPGPYPVTPEEREAAARKYGLRPDEYEPYPDDGLGKGDYPKLPVISADARDPYRDWDFPEHRRNFGEPIQVDYDMHGLDRLDVTTKLRYSLGQQAMAFFGVMTAFFVVYFYLDDKKMHWPVLAKQFPGQGQVHYTFEAPE
ncbi:NADH dehydrogenase [ubiquinone] 1 beta subcomplex subunit 8, mitochondrial-like [Macrobrachium nipponense]|uniref:NADH dehydrogenase [ubiquinone] 1 beta subcomplex subunit 8, mitochondrial-like n=1 Tax=Macrobrachium nipponense TaxID=159736 RepID=UPI0030C83CC8